MMNSLPLTLILLLSTSSSLQTNAESSSSTPFTPHRIRYDELVGASNSGSGSGAVPTFSVTDLRRITSFDGDDINRRDEFLEVLSTTGLLAVRLEEEEGDYERDRRVALDGLCACSDHPSFLTDVENTREIALSPSTKRTSIGTATVGLDHPLPLPKGLEKACGESVLIAMDNVRDVVAKVSKEFAEALDRAVLGFEFEEESNSEEKNCGSSCSVILRDDSRKKRYRSVTGIVNDANNLEHFHVYTQVNKDGNEDDIAWDWHTDAGLFLSFVPAWDCNGEEHNNDESFYYRDGRNEGKKPIRAEFDGDRTVVIMLGQGAEDWLKLPNKNKPLKATSHSVRWNKNAGDDNSSNKRAWYGMMNLVPESAMIHGGQTLRDVKQSLSLSHQTKNDFKGIGTDDSYDSSSLSLGCGNAMPSPFLPTTPFESANELAPVSRQRRRRIMETKDPSMCNNVTNFFCWMTCMDVPEQDQAALYQEAGYSLYCVDESVLDQNPNDLATAHEPCVDRHNMACVGSWEKTQEGVPVAAVIETNSTAAANLDLPFCYGGTSMFMEGFQWIQSSTCVILLFPSFVLNSAGKYAAAAIGVFALAILMEGFIQQRRRVMATMTEGKKRLVVSAIFYGIQLTLGYILMLVIMIYSGVLFIAVILGLVVGHVLFNALDAVWPLKRQLQSRSKSQSDRFHPNNLNKVQKEGMDDNETKTTTSGMKAAKPESATNGGGAVDAESDLSCCRGNGGEEEEQEKGGDHGIIPEGSTPCCQWDS